MAIACGDIVEFESDQAGKDKLNFCLCVRDDGFRCFIYVSTFHPGRERASKDNRLEAANLVVPSSRLPDGIAPSPTGWSVFGFETFRPRSPEYLRLHPPGPPHRVDASLAAELLAMCSSRLGFLNERHLMLTREQLSVLVETSGIRSTLGAMAAE